MWAKSHDQPRTSVLLFKSPASIIGSHEASSPSQRSAEPCQEGPTNYTPGSPSLFHAKAFVTYRNRYSDFHIRCCLFSCWLWKRAPRSGLDGRASTVSILLEFFYHFFCRSEEFIVYILVRFMQIKLLSMVLRAGLMMCRFVICEQIWETNCVTSFYFKAFQICLKLTTPCCLIKLLKPIV